MKGDLFINGVDAYTTYGLGISEAAISALICPPANKELIRNESRLTPGAQYIVGAQVPDERQLTLEAYIKADNITAMYTALNTLYNSVFKAGLFTLKTSDLPDVTFKLKYNNFRQFTEFNGRLANFILNVTEPDPTDR
ncbi:MAG: hypothetical protein MJZ26_09145 [Fibrobacter sp.]|nr:hypothetical protein [Fibrobacter sp.]